VMFQVSPHYRGWTNGPDGDHFFSYELLNVADAYGEKLPGLLDANGDGIPDILQKDQPTRTAGESNEKPAPAAKTTKNKSASQR
ncbi:MAG TPA: hypothetical protein VMM92_06875, partial [Thermoanaerobaculia bacterium]|nr:hypothetical protein [Thermoanaerobaculia bacterium]